MMYIQSSKCQVRVIPIYLPAICYSMQSEFHIKFVFFVILSLSLSNNKFMIVFYTVLNLLVNCALFFKGARAVAEKHLQKINPHILILHDYLAGSILS